MTSSECHQSDVAEDKSEAEIVTGSREQLLHLLAEAAEIEHMLMCSYLYAAFSLKRRDESGLTDAQGEAIERWRKAIMDVAVEEMGHLLIVANLTLAVGGRPHFARPNFPVSPGYFPAAVVVRLSGFSEETLDHFIFLERPQGIEGEDAKAYRKEDYSRDQAVHGLMPAPQDYATIGHLYEAIRANIRSLARWMGEDALFLSGTAGQVGAEDVAMDGVAAVGDVAGAMKAIDVVVEQGEGSPADREESHYRTFLAIRAELDRLRERDSGFSPAWPVADNPVLRTPQAGDDRCIIDNPESARLLDFSCAVYGLLLRILVQSFARSGPAAAADRAPLLDVSFTLMHVLAAAGAALARRPAGPTHPGVNAGMTFTMLRGVEPLLGGKVEQALIRERLGALAAAAAALADIGERFGGELGVLAASFSLQGA